jgi:hypothetical protein
MSNLLMQLYDAVEAIDNTTELFYQQKIDDGYVYLQNTLEKLISINDLLHNYYLINEEAEIEKSNLNLAFNEALGALAEKDMILLSDILQFEIKDYLMSIINKKDTTICGV